MPPDSLREAKDACVASLRGSRTSCGPQGEGESVATFSTHPGRRRAAAVSKDGQHFGLRRANARPAARQSSAAVRKSSRVFPEAVASRIDVLPALLVLLSSAILPGGSDRAATFEVAPTGQQGVSQVGGSAIDRGGKEPSVARVSESCLMRTTPPSF